MSEQQNNQKQISLNNQKSNLKNLENEIAERQNRIKRLKMKQQKQKQTQLYQKKKANEILKKKIQIQEIIASSYRDKNKQLAELQELKQKNRQYRQNQKQQIHNIKQAIYLVKLDEAREMKNVKRQHKQKIEQMKRSIINENKDRYEAIKQISGKQLHKQFEKKKILKSKLDQLQHYSMLQSEKREKQKILNELRAEQEQLLQKLKNQSHKTIDAKRQYAAAFILPRKSFIDRINPETNSQISLNKSNSNQNYRSLSNQKQTNQYDAEKYKLPKTSLASNPKFKMILEKLKQNSLKNKGLY